MKKLFAIMIIALFLFSLVPIVFAEKDGAGAIKEQLATLKEQAKEKRNEIKAELEKSREEKKDEREKLREQLKSCKGDDKSEGCKDSKTKMKKDVQERLLKQADKIVELINDLKSKVEKLNPVNKADLVVSLDAEIAKVEATKVKINALTNVSTKEEVKAVSKELQDEWALARKSVRLHATRMMALGFERVLVKAEKLETKFDGVLAKLKEKGFDTSVSKAKTDEFKAHIADSRKAYDEAKVLLTEYQKDASKENAVQAIQEKMKEAKKDLQLAQQSLKDAVKEIKKAKDGVKALEEATKEADKEAKTESDKAEQRDADKLAPTATA